MPGIWGDGQRGGIFGAKVDPRLLAELEQRAAQKRQMAQGLESAAAADTTIGSRALDWWNNSTLARMADPRTSPIGPAAIARLFYDPAGEAGRQVEAGRQLAEPFTQFNDPNVNPVKQATDLTLATMGGSSVVPAEANSLRMGIKAFRDIRPPKEDVWETVQGHANHGTVIGDADVDINKLTGGHRLSDPATRKRVDTLKAKIGGDDGYIERLIVDDTGNVIEGAHRLDALRELGAKTVPATVIRDLGRGVPIDKVEAAVRSAGETRGEQSRQIVQNVLEMANDVGLDNIASQYTFPRGFEASHQAAIDALKGQTLETAEQVKARLAQQKGKR